MNKYFLPFLTKAINSYLGLDPESKIRLHKLQNKAITIELLPFHFSFHCIFTESSMTIGTDANLQTETTIRGTPLQMLGVMINKQQRQHFFSEDLHISGNAELGQQVVALFDELQIDWEEYLAQVIGDVPAYHMGQFVRRVTAWFNHTEKLFTQDVSDYLHEEAQWLPAREALQDFFSEIDTLRMDVDRIEAKIMNIRASIAEVST